MTFLLRTKRTVLLICCLYTAAGAAAESITGNVHNQTTNRPSAGDDVVLFRLGNGMEVEARTRTDAQGAFSLPGSVSEAQHVIRVLHQGVNYDRTVSGTAPQEISVYDAVPKIPGLSGNLGILQVESDGTTLKLTEMYSINNVSNPPVTQLGPRNFEISIPPKAVLDSVMVKRAASIWVNVTPAQLRVNKIRYAVDFPLQPGATLFKFVYRLPQEDSTLLHLKLAYPIQNFAVLHHPSMSFKPLRPQTFSSPGRVQGLQLEQVVSKPVVGDVPAFKISGVGAAPAPIAGEKATSVQPAVVSDAHPNASPRQTPVSDPALSSNEMLALGSALVSLLAVAVVALWRRKRVRGHRTTRDLGSRTPAVETLKQELLQLETDRLRGAITGEQYQSSRHALDLSIQRAIPKGKS